jgi:peptidyl-prolyl cis-trans isomerase A (cyclophilin A)
MLFQNLIRILLFASVLVGIVAFVGKSFALVPKEDVEVDFVTSRGTVKFDLFKQKESDFVDYFLKYVDSGFYNNTIFHRILEGFVLQGGGYDVGFKEKIIVIKSQLSPVRSQIKNTAGTIALILRKDNSPMLSPQFFINLADNLYLDAADGNFEYHVIGKVFAGMEIVEKIARIKVGQREGMYNVPFYPNEAVIKSVFIAQ